MKQKAVRTGGLVAMVFDKKRLARKPSEKQGSEGRPGNVHHIGFSNELPQMDESWLADHAKRKVTIVAIPCRGLRDKRNFELRRAVRITKSGKATGEGKDDSLYPTDAGRKEMAVDEEFHPSNSSETVRERSVSTVKAISMTSLVIRVCVRMSRNSRQYSGWYRRVKLAAVKWTSAPHIVNHAEKSVLIFPQ